MRTLTKFFRALFIIIGIAGALLALEGLNRFIGLMAAFSGEDLPFYIAMSAVAAIAGLYLLIGLFGVANRWITVLIVLMVIICGGLLLLGPTFGVSLQILIGFAAIFVGLLAIKSKCKTG